uniref:Uncharacterized protein n=1 Tax=Ascaris lumbricoides TaxID=6252 RepID=A0A9J2PPW2_ASCLU
MSARATSADRMLNAPHWKALVTALIDESKHPAVSLHRPLDGLPATSSCKVLPILPAWPAGGGEMSSCSRLLFINCHRAFDF